MPKSTQPGYEHDLHKNLARSASTTSDLVLLSTSTRYLQWHSLLVCVECHAMAHAPSHQRLDEIAGLLAVALMRLHGKKSSQFGSNGGESLLDLSPEQSGDAHRVATEERDD